MSRADVTIPQGSGMLEAPELLLRQVLLEGLVELAGDAARQDELFARVDALSQGSQDEWAEDFKAELRRMARIGGDGGIAVGVGYPMDDAHYPYVSIVTDSSAESAAGASMGDVLGRTHDVIGTPSADPLTSVTTRYETIGVDYTTTVQVGCWALAAEQSILLLTVVRHLLFRHKGRLTVAGVRDVSLSESGFQPNPQDYPRTGYVPVVRCSMEWTYRQNRVTRPVPTRVTIARISFYN